jgi:hypothetical protein
VKLDSIIEPSSNDEVPNPNTNFALDQPEDDLQDDD